MLKKDRITIFVIIAIFLLFFIYVFIIQADGVSSYYSSQIYRGSRDVTIAKRGDFFDVNGAQITQNKEIFRLRYNNPEDSYSQEISDFFQKEWVDAGAFLEISVDNLQEEQLAWLSGYVESNSINGISVSKAYQREVIHPDAYSHIIGYLGYPTKEEVASGLDSNLKVGKYGLEAIFQQDLKGRDGLTSGQINVLPEKGKDLNLSVNDGWQRMLFEYAKRSVNKNKGESGAVIISEIKTGKINAYVNYPTFNPNSFNRGISSREYSSLLNSPANPLVDKITGVSSEPGSIFKVPVTASLLSLDLIDTTKVINSQGCIKIGDSNFCEYGKRELGYIDLSAALAKSSNIYFCEAREGYNNYQLLLDELNKLGIDRNINFPINQIAVGSINKSSQFLGDYCNTVIGQGQTQVNPLQMLNAINSIFTNSIYDEELGYTFLADEHRSGSLEIDYSINPLSKGMKDAVNTGTARRLNFSNLDVFAKTGSAETKKQQGGRVVDSVHGWVVGRFNYKDKDYSFVVAVRHGGGSYAALDIMQPFLECLSTNSDYCL